MCVLFGNWVLSIYRVIATEELNECKKQPCESIINEGKHLVKLHIWLILTIEVTVSMRAGLFRDLV